jgi:hypothetical protein
LLLNNLTRIFLLKSIRRQKIFLGGMKVEPNIKVEPIIMDTFLRFIQGIFLAKFEIASANSSMFTGFAM